MASACTVYSSAIDCVATNSYLGFTEVLDFAESVLVVQVVMHSVDLLRTHYFTVLVVGRELRFEDIVSIVI